MIDAKKNGATGRCANAARPLGMLSNQQALAMTPRHVRGGGSVTAYRITRKRGLYDRSWTD